MSREEGIEVLDREEGIEVLDREKGIDEEECGVVQKTGLVVW